MLWGLLQLATASAIVTETMITAWQPATGSSEPGGSDVVLAPHLHGGSPARCACTGRLGAQCAARWRCAKRELGSHLPSRSRGKKGPQGLNPAFPATGVPRMRSFWQARSRLLPTCRGFRAPAVPGYEGELPQGSFGGCNVRSQGSGFPPMGPGEHQCSPGSCLPHCQRGGTFTGVKHAPLSLPPALSVSLM